MRSISQVKKLAMAIVKESSSKAKEAGSGDKVFMLKL